MTDTTRMPASDPLAEAQGLVDRIGGFHGNSAPELSPPAIALALIGIGHELRALRVAVERTGTAGDAGDSLGIAGILASLHDRVVASSGGTEIDYGV